MHKQTQGTEYVSYLDIDYSKYPKSSAYAKIIGKIIKVGEKGRDLNCGKG